MFYLNTIEQLFLLVEQLDQLEVCLPYSRLVAGIPILAEFQNLRLNSNKTSLCISFLELCHQTIHVSQLRQLNSKITWPLKTSRKRPVKILRCVLKFVIGVSVKSNSVTFQKYFLPTHPFSVLSKQELMSIKLRWVRTFQTHLKN